MTDSLSQALQSAKDQTEKAAIVAEAAFALLPEITALVARRCVVLHWFDALIVEALLEDSELTLDEIGLVYAQLATLPFIDTVPWGLAFQNGTRTGLLKRYTTTQPELLQTAARIAAPAYDMREEEKRCVAEAFFCYLVAGDQVSSVTLQTVLFEEASNNQDWWYLDSLLQLQAEAERLPFVLPLPRTEQFFLLQGLVHRVQNKRDAALFDYQQALNINPISVLAYVSRGTTHAEQNQYEKALADYNSALRVQRNFAPAYLSRGVIYNKQGKYKDALRDNDKAMQLGLNTDAVFINRANILNGLGQYEDALAACDAALRLNPDAVDGYIGKGQALNMLERYNEALQTYEMALTLNPSLVDAYIGKGQALNELQRYEDALTAYNTAIRLGPTIAEAFRGKGKALSSLKRYEEATAAYEQADRIEPSLPQEEIVEYEGIDEEEKPRRPNQTERVKDAGPVTFFGRLARVFHVTRQPARRTPRTFWRGVNNTFGYVAVGILVTGSLLIFSIHNASVGGMNAYATATAIGRIATSLAQINGTVPSSNATATTQAQINVNATATVLAINNEATATAYTTAISGTLVLADSLQDNNQGYKWDTTSIVGGGGCAFTGNTYHSTMPQLNNFSPCFAQVSNFSNFSYEVQMTIIKGNQGGIAFRADSSKGAFYYFHINTSRVFQLDIYNSNLLSTTLNQGSSSTINTNLNEPNLLAVIARGGNLELYINQQHVASVTDTTYVQGQIGVVAENVGNPVDVAFSNVKVWAL